MGNTLTSNDKTVADDAKVKLIIGEIGRDTQTGIIGRGYSFDNGNTFHVTDTIYGRLYTQNDADGLWNNGLHEKVKEKVNQEITNTVEPVIKQADSAVAYANEAIEKSRVNSQAIVDINSAVSDAVSDAAVARSDGLRAWNAAQSNADLIDSNYASASAAISSVRAEAIAAADEAKASASAAQADIVAVRSDVAAVQADVTTNKSDVAATKSDIADTKTNLTSQAKSLSSYASQASAAGKDITTLKSQAGQLEQDMVDTKGDVSQLKVSAISASVALSDAAGNISSLQASAKSYSAALSDAKGDIATVKATASELETKYADAAGDISQIKTDAKGMTQTISDAQGDIAKLKTRADGFDAEFTTANGNISKLQTDASGTQQTLTNAKSDIAVLQSRADGFDTKYSNVAGDINTLKADAKGFSQTLTDAQGNISTLQSDVAGLKKTTSDHAGNIATLQADAKTLTSQISDVQGDISTLQQAAEDTDAKITANSTAIEQNKKAIALKADQTDVDKVNGTVSQLQSSLTVQAGQIQEKVTSSQVTGMLTGYATQEYTQLLVTQKADEWNLNLTKLKNDTQASVTNLSAAADGIKALVKTKADMSEVTQLSNLVQTKVSSGDFTSTTTQLKNLINQRVQVGDVISQINQEAGGNTLIQVSNGKGSLILDAGNTIVTGKAWIPVASIADLTADDIKTGTLTGSTVHLDDDNGNTIDLGSLATDYVGFHSKATNGDQTYIDLNGIHNYGSSYDTRISQGKITTNLLAVNGGGLIDFRSGGNGTTIDSQNIKFYNSNAVNGGIEFSGGSPLATVRDGAVGNELRVRYDRSFALTPIKDESARICASSAAMQVGFIQSGSSTPDRKTTGLWVDSDSRHVNLGVWGADSTWARVEANTHNIHMQADKAHAWLSSDDVFRIYKDGDSSSTAIKLQVDGWAWINGWVEAAGHSQHSALSTKTEIQPVDDDKMLKMVNDTDLATFLYKTDVANGETHRHIGLIIDDVHDVAQYQTPQEFIAPNGVSRDDDNMIGALFGAVKALTKRIKTLESKVG